MSFHIKKGLLIANPTAQSGRGAEACTYAAQALGKVLGPDQLKVVHTEGPRHGQYIAENARGFDTVIVLGGDGLIHEVVNGLMSIEAFNRPRMALLPAGTGNDYARTLGMSFRIEESVSELFKTQEYPIDLGVCNGEYFAETLSFGLDADIALDTVERRLRTGKTGTALFLESGIDVLLHRMNKHAYCVSFDGQEFQKDEMYQFAIQIGKTYGGGFVICPKAHTDDGLFDICIAHPPLSIPKATEIFLLAKNGRHTKFKQIEFVQAQAMNIEFLGQEQVPAQIDGERLLGHKFEISCENLALKVLALKQG